MQKQNIFNLQISNISEQQCGQKKYQALKPLVKDDIVQLTTRND